MRAVQWQVLKGATVHVLHKCGTQYCVSGDDQDSVGSSSLMLHGMLLQVASGSHGSVQRSLSSLTYLCCMALSLW
jgi:hypothetical protein